MTVRTKFKGRFGNNMFQYVFARILAEKFHQTLETGFDNPIVTCTPSRPHVEPESSRTIRINDANAGWIIATECCDDNLALNGYFQNSGFYNPLRDQIKSYFQLTPLERDDRNLVMHLHLGDFNHEEFNANIIHPQWYLDILEREVFDQLYIVCEVPTAGRRQDQARYLSWFDRYRPIVVSGSAHSDFHFIRRFGRIICSNSTFSFWACFLSEALTIYTVNDWGMGKLKAPGRRTCARLADIGGLSASSDHRVCDITRLPAPSASHRIVDYSRNDSRNVGALSRLPGEIDCNKVTWDGLLVFCDVFVTFKLGAPRIAIIGPLLPETLRNRGVSYDSMQFLVDSKPAAPETIDDPHAHTYLAIFPQAATGPLHRLEVQIGDSHHKITLDVEHYRREQRFLEGKQAMTTMFAAENNLIESWCDYHSRVGFEHFLLYNNHPDDRRAYADLKDKHAVTFIDWSAPHRQAESGISGQTTQQNHSIWRFSGVDLLALTDLDEYIVFDVTLPVGRPLLQGHCALSLDCYWFGCNHGAAYSQRNFIHKLTCREHEEGRKAPQRKCIVDPRRVHMVSIHEVLRATGPVRFVDPCEARINHYRIINDKQRSCDCAMMDAVSDTRILDLYTLAPGRSRRGSLAVRANEPTSEISPTALDFVPIRAPGYRLTQGADGMHLHRQGALREIRCNETAAMVWGLCDGIRSVQDCFTLLAESYSETPEETILEAVRTALVELTGAGIFTGISKHRGNFALLTAASSNHFAALQNLLTSIEYHEPDSEVVVYDIGLTTTEQLAVSDRGFTLKSFPFEQYDPALVEPHRRVYAWKPVIVYDELQRYDTLLYLDAGNLLHAPLERIRKMINQLGVYCPASSGDLADWTHPTTLRLMNVSPDLRTKRNRNAAVLGIKHDDFGCSLIRDWCELSLDPAYICPAGSGLNNHRQDQAILSVLLAQREHLLLAPLSSRGPEISVQNDSLSVQEAYQAIRRKLSISVNK